MTRFFAFVLFAATIPAANCLINSVGDCSHGPCVIPVWPGIYAPSGVLMIGVALVLRDWLHEIAGWRWAVAAILIGSTLSAVLSPSLALASGAAFLFAEMADLIVYARLRRQGRAMAVAASGLVGAVVDSALFLFLAFGSLDFMSGNVIGKIYASIAVGAFLWWRRK